MSVDAEVDFFAYLSGVAGVIALCPAIRITPLKAPEEQKPKLYPRILYGLQDSGIENTLDGRDNATTPTMTVECYDLTALATRTLSKAVKAAVAAYPQNASAGLQAMLLTEERSDFEQDQQGGDIGIYKRSLDVWMFYKE